MTFKCFNVVKTCIPDEEAIQDIGCDILFGKSHNSREVDEYWEYNTIYNTDTVSALYNSNVRYTPWDFLKPFDLQLWILIMIVLFILTPVVMSIVEYDEGETVLGNYVKFLPDSVHAHTGVDLVNNDLPAKNTSYVLSVFVSLFAFITISLYASNLTAFVLYNNNADPLVHISPSVKILVEDSVYSMLHINKAIPVIFNVIPGLHETGQFDYIVAENYLLRNIKKCDETIVPLEGVGVSKYVFIARKFGEENIKKLKENIRGIEYVFDTSRELCDNRATPISLSGIYGLFLIFFIPAFIILIIVLIRRFFIKNKTNQYITNSP